MELAKERLNKDVLRRRSKAAEKDGADNRSSKWAQAKRVSRH